MTPIRIALAIAFCAAAFGQSGFRIMGGSATSDKVRFYFEIRLAPPSPSLAPGISGGVTNGSSGTHRYMLDHTNRKYFGYDIQIEPVPRANAYQITLRPLGIGPESIVEGNPAAWTLLPLPVYPAPQTMHAGDTMALDLFTNAGTGQKIVEYIQIQDRLRETAYADSGAARDFTVADAELRLMDPHVSINGKLIAATADFSGGVTGAAVWFYLPDRGRYFLSLVPHPELGFQKAGEIRGSSLRLTIGADAIDLDCNGRVAPGYSPYNVYVLYDASWRPRNAKAAGGFLLTAGDHLEDLLHR